jgi:hypothetical protein
VCYDVVIRTSNLTKAHLSNPREQRLRLMNYLSDMGYSTKQITDYLNHNRIKTPKGLAYYPKLVWVTLFKYRRRIEQLGKGYEYSVDESLVYVERK